MNRVSVLVILRFSSQLAPQQSACFSLRTASLILRLHKGLFTCAGLLTSNSCFSTSGCLDLPVMGLLFTPVSAGRNIPVNL